MTDEDRAVLEHDVVAGWQGLLTGEELVVQLGVVTATATDGLGNFSSATGINGDQKNTAAADSGAHDDH